MTNATDGLPNGKTLIVYYSLTGNTARVAHDLAQRLGGELESIRDREHGAGILGFIKCSFDALRGTKVDIAPIFRNPRDYSLVIVGTPVWAGKMTPAMRTYLQQFRGQFRQLVFFTTSGNTDVERLVPA